MTPDTESMTPRRASRAAGEVVRSRRTPIELPRNATASGVDPPPDGRVRQACELCGQPVRVHVLAGYAHGQPLLRRFCLRCAARAPSSLDGQADQRARLRLSVLVGLVGLSLGALAIFGDWFIPFHVTAGFGRHKELGVALGALLVVVGALLRADLVALGGMFVFAGSLVAGLFGLAHSPGMGWKQHALLEFSAGCVLLAVLGRLGLAAYVRRTVRRLRKRREHARARRALDGGISTPWSEKRIQDA